MVEAPNVRFAEQAAMRVEWKLAVELDLPVFHEINRAARLEVTHRFKLQQHDIAEAIVNLQKIHILRRHAGHAEGLGGRIA